MNKRVVLGFVFSFVVYFVCALAPVVAAPSVLAMSEEVADGPVAALQLTAANVEDVLDRAIQSRMDVEGIAGAIVAVVADGEVLLSKGYGTANVRDGIAVDPDRTLFRIGSLSKLFVWTAVMQLVENGQLDLDTDVNEYVDFEIPNRLYGRGRSAIAAPITLKHLMTDSAGLEDVPADLFHLRPEDTISLEEYIRTHVPARVFPPGEVSAYSNYGSALGGYIVQRVSGMPFAHYVEQNIFGPLHMERSTFRQPVEPALADDVARGYRFADGQFIEGDFVYALGPAGAMSTTAANMARFMLAHLHGGAVDGQRILSEDAVRHMHSPLFSQHAALDGMTHGFLQQTRNGQPVLYRMGSVLIFNSGLYLLPEASVGLFVSFNGGSHLAPIAVFREFMNALYPGDGVAANAAGSVVAVPALAPGLTASTDARGGRAYAGEYLINRRSFTTATGLLSFLETVRVEANDDGALYVTHFGQTEEFVEVEPGMYRNRAPDSSLDPYGAFATIVFARGSGSNTFLLSDGPMSYTKAPWYATSAFTLTAVLIPMLLLVGTGVVWLIGVLVARVRRRTARNTAVATFGRVVAASFTLVTTVFLVGSLGVSGEMEPAYGIPKSYFGIEPEWSSFLNALPPLMIVLGAAMALYSAVAWRKKLWGMGERIHYTVMSVCALVLLTVLRAWHVI